MKICASILPSTIEQAHTMLHKAGRISDLVELRIDGLHNRRFDELMHKPRPKLIITNRHKDEGGRFSGTPHEQFETLCRAMALGAEYVDVALQYGMDFIRALREKSGSTKLICSYHNFDGTPANLIPIFKKLKATGADIIKVSTMAHDISDNLTLFTLGKAARRERIPAILIAMGEHGQASRILGGISGSFLTFASIDDEHATGPGQVTAEQLQSVYRATQVTRSTAVFGLVGNPVRHSRGIFFHNERFRKLRLDAIYVNFLVEDLPCFFEGFLPLVRGLSVTMPFKESVLPYLDSVDPQIQSLGAINTILKRRGKLFGTNTDLPAIRSSLDKRITLRGKHAVVIGTGGTARTMAYAALAGGATVTILGRSEEKATQLAQMLGCHWGPLGQLRKYPADIVMNATPVGMANAKKSAAVSLVPRSYLKSRMVVFDAVYNPSLTPLIRDALGAGCKVITGEELYRRQAKLQSEMFIECIR